jgi:hypothetical protein
MASHLKSSLSQNDTGVPTQMGTFKIIALFEIAVQADLQMKETVGKSLVKISGFLSLVLRHQLQKIGLERTLTNCSPHVRPTAFGSQAKCQ